VARVLLAIVLAALVGVSLADTASAQKKRREPPKTRRVETASPKVYKHLQAAHEALAEGNYTKTKTELDKIQSMSKLSKYEQALMHQAYGYMYASQGNYKQAMGAFEKTVAAGGLSEQEQLNIRYNLGQLYIANDQFKKGIQTLEGWLADANNPSAEPYFLIANAYVQLEQYDPALDWVNQGLQRASEPRESWLQLALALYYEKKQYADCANVLEQLVARYPKKEYWKQLSGMYEQLGEDQKQLAAFELAHRQGLLTESRELVMMAQLFLFHDVPYKAAVLLEQSLADGRIAANADNWELLANSWIHAREYARSEAPLAKAAQLSDDGDLYLRLGEVYVEGERWKEAQQALEKAVSKGELSDPGQAHLLLGIAQFQHQQLDASRRSFTRATQHENSRRAARQWLRYLDQAGAS